MTIVISRLVEVVFVGGVGMSARLGELQRLLHQDRARKAQQSQELQDLNCTINELRATVDRLQAQLDEATTVLETLDGVVAKGQADNRELQCRVQAFKERAVASEEGHAAAVGELRDELSLAEAALANALVRAAGQGSDAEADASTLHDPKRIKPREHTTKDNTVRAVGGSTTQAVYFNIATEDHEGEVCIAELAEQAERYDDMVYSEYYGAILRDSSIDEHIGREAGMVGASTRIPQAQSMIEGLEGGRHEHQSNLIVQAATGESKAFHMKPMADYHRDIAESSGGGTDETEAEHEETECQELRAGGMQGASPRRQQAAAAMTVRIERNLAACPGSVSIWHELVLAHAAGRQSWSDLVDCFEALMAVDL